MNIEQIFNKLRLKSKELNEKNENFDGLKFWRSLKEEFASSNFKSKSWKKISNKIIKNVMQMPEYYIDGYGKQEIIEVNHFLIQSVRIPTQDKPSLRKIMQVALNIGQFQGKKGRSEYMKNRTKCSDYISKKDCDIKINTVLSEKSIKKILKILK